MVLCYTTEDCTVLRRTVLSLSAASVNKSINERIMRKMEKDGDPLDFGDVLDIHLDTRSQGLLFGSDDEIRQQGCGIVQLFGI